VTLTPAERADSMAGILRPSLLILADPASSPEDVAGARGILERILELLDAIHPRGDPIPAERREPKTRAPAREAGRDDDEARKADGLHPLRQGADQCSAHRRDGEPCQAPAVKGTLVCRRHGGAAPQVLIKARHLELQMALHDTAMGHQEAKGTPREFDALCKWSHAERELKEYEAKLADLSELRAELRRREAGRETGTDTDPMEAPPE
jgi:hypothetical protein